MKKPVITHSNPAVQQKAFTYFVKDYDSKKRIYILHNPVTKDIKMMSKEQFEMMLEEQHPVSKNKEDNENAHKGKSVDINHNS